MNTFALTEKWQFKAKGETDERRIFITSSKVSQMIQDESNKSSSYHNNYYESFVQERPRKRMFEETVSSAECVSVPWNSGKNPGFVIFAQPDFLENSAVNGLPKPLSCKCKLSRCSRIR
mmetsp:Transcript_43133/g.115334  ORF Transcript_43133/g.115334 Transcript_43133/m.115334 type:complete len:119 (-) Transcript_43133:715-1071(-)